MDWIMITAIATTVSALTIAVSALLISLQLRRQRLSQEVTVALTLYDRSTCSEMLEAASWVKSKMSADITYENYLRDPDIRQKLERLWYYFEFLGVLVNRGYVNENLIFDQQGVFIAGIWDKSQSLIKARRQDKNSPQYMENFEVLRNRFVRWGIHHRPKLSPQEMRRTQAYYENEYLNFRNPNTP